MEDVKRGMEIRNQISVDATLTDITACTKKAADMFGAKKVAVVGYCWGGTLAWLAATSLDVAAAVSYYGGLISKYAAETPRCPVMLHFGKRDAHIPKSEIDAIRQAHPNIPVYLYDAGHGFNCDQRGSYEPESAALARQRTLDFLKQHL